MNKSMPDLREIRHPRHPGVTRAVCESFAEAAEVCLARHHKPPETLLTVDCDGSKVNLALQWRAPDGTAKRAWSNRDDATRDGAYIVSLATVESELGLVALSRAETRTGADYYVGDPESPDLESAYRLEVSGVDSGTGSTVRARLREKVLQAAKGRSNLPAYASVVGFREALVMVEEVR